MIGATWLKTAFSALSDGYAGWTTSAEAPRCPCANVSLCAPISTPIPSTGGVFAFHVSTANDTAWREYDWSQVSTVCVFGAVDPELLCHAHSVGARLTLGNGGITETAQWSNATAVSSWIARSNGKVGAAFADGYNIDIEIESSGAADAAALAAMTIKAVAALKAINPASQISFDVPSQGQGACGQMYGRAYGFSALADAVDFLVVMDYDSGAARSALPARVWYTGAPSAANRSYRYGSRQVASAACVAGGDPTNPAGQPPSGISRLCAKAEVAGFSMCAAGWMADFKGFWMESAAKGCGGAGFNTWSGADAGAYCCSAGGAYVPPCPTCYFANAALPVVARGVKCYVETLQIAPEKLVLAFPWYGYDYACAAGDSIERGWCHTTGATQRTYLEILALRAAHAEDATPPTAVVFDANSSTPHFFYTSSVAAGATRGSDGSRPSAPLAAAAAAAFVARGECSFMYRYILRESCSQFDLLPLTSLTISAAAVELHRVDFDSSASLRAKYALAKAQRVRGVGMWTASMLASNRTAAAQFWSDLKVFTKSDAASAPTAATAGAAAPAVVARPPNAAPSEAAALANARRVSESACDRLARPGSNLTNCSIHFPGAHGHCAEFDVANAHDVDCFRSYWGTKGYEYANYTRGACPAVFNRTTTNESVCGFGVWIVSKDIP